MSAWCSLSQAYTAVVVDVPVVDVGPLVSGTGQVDAVAKALDRACSEVGFFYIVGHGVDPELRRRLDELARRFFELPEDDKAEIAMARTGRDDAAARWDRTSVHGFRGTYGDGVLGKVSKVFPDLATEAVDDEQPSHG